MNRGKNLNKLLSLGRVFWDSQVLLTAVKLRVFDYLIDWNSSNKISKSLNTDARATSMLLDALTSLGFLIKKNDRYKVKEDYRDFLLSSSENNVLAIIDHYYNMWDDWAKLIECLKTGKAIEKNVDMETKKAYTKAFITGMDNLTKFQKDRILNTIDLKGVKKILDVGSGPATYIREILKKNKAITATIVDLPLAASVGREFIEKDKLQDRVSFIEGDLKDVDFGDGYDCAFIFQVLHALDFETKKLAVKKAYEALKKDGRLYIHEFYLGENKTFPKDSVIFRLNMLIHADGGDNLTPSEIKNLLTGAGFRVTKVVKFKNPATVIIEGTK